MNRQQRVAGAVVFVVFTSCALVIGMSRTYNLPSAEVAGTFGQGLPGIPRDRMIPAGVKKRILFMNEDDDLCSNVGCQNGSRQTVRVLIELFDSEGESLETRTMDPGALLERPAQPGLARLGPSQRLRRRLVRSW